MIYILPQVHILQPGLYQIRLYYETTFCAHGFHGEILKVLHVLSVHNIQFFFPEDGNADRNKVRLEIKFQTTLSLNKSGNEYFQPYLNNVFLLVTQQNMYQYGTMVIISH